jgi:hypothetical protein
MQSFHLTSYISSPLFLEEIKKKNLPYDTILSDIPYETTPLPFYGLHQKPLSKALLPYRAEQIEQAQHPLLILGQLPVSFITPLLAKFPDKSLTIINLYAGMGSFGRKTNSELGDIDALLREFPKYEPRDAVNVFSILEQPSAKYLRIPHQHFPESIFSTEDIAIIDAQMLNTVDTLSLRGYGYAGENGTIITTGANFATILQVGELLHEQEKAMDIFVVSKLNVERTEEMLSSLHQTKKLIWIMDYLVSEEFKDRITHALALQELKNTSVHYLHPNYKKLTTIFDEFSAQQAEFDAAAIAESLSDFL